MKSQHRLSGRWTMSSLLKTSATQENPIFDIRPPLASPPPSPPTSASSDPSSITSTETASSSAITSTTTPPANSTVVLSHPEATESRHPPPPVEIIIPAVNRNNSDPPPVDTPDAPSSQIGNSSYFSYKVGWPKIMMCRHFRPQGHAEVSKCIIIIHMHEPSKGRHDFITI